MTKEDERQWSEAGKMRASFLGGWYCEECCKQLINLRDVSGHHIWPRILGGEHTAENRRNRCGVCEKSDKHWLASNHYLIRQKLLAEDYNEVRSLLEKNDPKALSLLVHGLDYYRGLVIKFEVKKGQVYTGGKKPTVVKALSVA